MKPIDNRITTILKDAERDFREVIAEAAKESDYPNVDVARLMALEMDKLLKRVKGPPVVKEPESSPILQHSTKKRKVRKSDYPKFAIRNGVLTRTGWSPKRKREYRQRIPGITFDQTLKAKASLSQTGNGSVLAEQIIEGVERINQDHVPSYQVYAVLGLLRHGKCVQQGGDGYYSWADQLEDKAGTVWSEYEGATA